MALINLGGFNTVNGRTTGLGLSSGLDSTSLIDTILEAKTAAVTADTETIEANNVKIAAVEELRTLLDRFKTTADFLRAPPGVNNENNDFFKHTSASLTSSTTTAASTYMSVASQAGATLGKYSITDVVIAKEHQIRKDGFTSKTASVVGNLSITDNYQASLGTVSGSVLNASTPITFSNDLQGSGATIDLVFGSQNAFGATDKVTFGSVNITFGGGGGDDIDISGASTVAEKVALIATQMNTKTTGDESLYTYTASGSTLTVTRDSDGKHADVNTGMVISSDFSVDAGDTTQTVAIGSVAAANVNAGGAVNDKGTEGTASTTATQAVMNMNFGTQNKFDATDQIVFGGTTVTFGGTGGADLDISTDTTLDLKLDRIVSYMNTVATGAESNYTYTRASSGVITMTRDTAGPIGTVGQDMTVTADFSKGTTDKTQTVSFGKNYQNNGSASGSVGRKNTAVSGTVSLNGVDGLAAATKATIDVQFGGNGASGDTMAFGTTSFTLGTEVAVGGSLAATIENIADYMNARTTGTEAGYKYESDGTDKLVITRSVYGDSATVDNTMGISSNFSTSGNTVKIGSAAATSAAQGPLALNTYGTDGVNQTGITDAMTSHTSTLSGAITINSAEFIEGNGTATTFTPNMVEFRATVGGVTYTSRPVVLEDGSINAGGAGSGGFGNRIASGTVLTFVKDSGSDTTTGTKDVTFQLTVGDATTIANQAGADTYATSINTWLNTTNTITVTQSPTVPPLRAGTFNLGGVDITLAEGDSLQTIETKINSVSATSGVTASIVQVSDTSFSLVLKSKNAGEENKILEFGDGDSPDGPTNTIQLGRDNVSFTQVQAASDASFKLDGQTITRSTNAISDVIDKVTFTLNSNTPTVSPPTLTLDVASNNDLVKSGVTDFLTAYNELRYFISAQTERDSNNELVETAVLGDESILRDVLSTIDSQLTRAVSGITSGAKDTLFKIGVDLFDFPGDTDIPATDDIFIIDDSKFDAAIAADFEELRNVFIFNFTANSTDLSIYGRTNSTTLTDYVLDIDTSRATGDQVRVLDPTTNALLFNMDKNGTSITGQDGTTLEGLSLIYTGDGTDSITVHGTRGIADSIYNVLDNYLVNDGFIDDAVEAFKDTNTRLQDSVDSENARIEIERELLIEKFTLLESVITQANNTLSFIEQQTSYETSGN